MEGPRSDWRRAGSPGDVPRTSRIEHRADERLHGLLALVAEGDRDAFATVYERVAGPVYGMALRVLRDPAQAEEVAQDVLVQVWQRAASFDPSRGSAMAWVMTIAHRRAVDQVRSAQASASRERHAAEQRRDRATDELETWLDNEAVRRCLDALTDLQRESVLLAYYAGYTYREVAGLLGVPPGTIKTRMRDGLIRLRDCLGARMGERG